MAMRDGPPRTADLLMSLVQSDDDEGQQPRQPESDESDAGEEQRRAAPMLGPEEGQQLPDGFAFPVTKKIIHLLNRFSTTGSGPGSVASNEDSGADSHEIAVVEAKTSSSSNNSSNNNNNKSNSSSSNNNSSNNSQDSNAIRIAPPASQSPRASAKSGDKTSSYAGLRDMLRDKRAAPVMASIQDFVRRFVHKAQQAEPTVELHALDEITWDGDRMPGKDNAQAAEVQRFLRGLEAQVRAHPLWARCTEAEWSSTVEGLEKFVMYSIMKHAFQPTSRDRYLDLKLKKRIDTLSFLRPEHLEVTQCTQENLPQWRQAAHELCKMNDFRSPRDKLVCVLNCCRLLTQVLRESADQVGADDFVPGLILIVLKANPANLHSNLEYIAAYRNPARLRGEPGYFFTQLTMATSFIQGLEPGLLAISEETFRRGVAECERRLELDSDFTFGWLGWPDAAVAAAGERQEEGGGKGKDDENEKEEDDDKNPRAAAELAGREAWLQERSRFADRDAESLTLGEVRELLAEYKLLLQAARTGAEHS